MSSETPGQDAGPDQAQPNPPAAEPGEEAPSIQPPAPAWTTPPPARAEPTPAATSWTTGAAQQPTAPAWGTPPSQGTGTASPQPPVTQPAPAQPLWGSPQQPGPAQPAQPAPQTSWGTPAAQAAAPAPAPQQAGWGSQPVAPAQPVAQQPQQPVAQQPVASAQPVAQQSQQPAAGQQPGWGAPPPQAPAPPQQPPAWNAPPAQPPGWTPPPGGAPPTSFAPAPAQSNNGCLKACLIAGIIAVVLVIVAVIGIVALGIGVSHAIISSVGVNPDGSIGQTCDFVSDSDLSGAMGQTVQARKLQGFFDATIGAVLDKRVLADNAGCWVTGDPSGTTGRIAKYSGSDAAARYKAEVDAANNGLYFDTAMPGVGDEAFCTQMSIAGSVGVLARKGDTLVYASFLDPSVIDNPSFALSPNGLTSATGCAASAKVAAALLH